MANGAPNRKIGIVTFNGEVSVVGDGSQAPVILAGDKLFNQDLLLEAGYKEGKTRMTQTVKDSKGTL